MKINLLLTLASFGVWALVSLAGYRMEAWILLVACISVLALAEGLESPA